MVSTCESGYENVYRYLLKVLPDSQRRMLEQDHNTVNPK